MPPDRNSKESSKGASKQKAPSVRRESTASQLPDDASDAGAKPDQRHYYRQPEFTVVKDIAQNQVYINCRDRFRKSLVGENSESTKNKHQHQLHTITSTRHVWGKVNMTDGDIAGVTGPCSLCILEGVDCIVRIERPAGSTTSAASTPYSVVSRCMRCIRGNGRIRCDIVLPKSKGTGAADTSTQSSSAPGASLDNRDSPAPEAQRSAQPGPSSQRRALKAPRRSASSGPSSSVASISSTQHIAPAIHLEQITPAINDIREFIGEIRPLLAVDGHIKLSTRSVIFALEGNLDDFERATTNRPSGGAPGKREAIAAASGVAETLQLVIDLLSAAGELNSLVRCMLRMIDGHVALLKQIARGLQ